MKIYKAYKIELKPNKQQIKHFIKACGIARFAFNWALEHRKKAYKEGNKTPSAYDQINALNAIKKVQFPWMYEVSKCVSQEALVDLDAGYKKFFRDCKAKKEVGKPKFKAKHGKRQSFRIAIEAGTFKISNTMLKLPKIKPVRLKQKVYVPIKDVKLISCTVSKVANRWFASICCQVDIAEPAKQTEEVIGVDLGISKLATCSDGQVFENNKTYYKYKRKLKRQHKAISRKKKGSQNRRKAVNALQVTYYKIGNIRKDLLHKLTSSLVRTKPRVIVIEDLAVSNMIKNRKLAKSLSDASFAEIRRQLTYKVGWYGGQVIVADRFFPSSKLCSRCESINNELKLSDRTYKCNCGYVADRDLNAAINLKKYFTTAGYAGSYAYGEYVRPAYPTGLQAGSLKQEESIRLTTN